MADDFNILIRNCSSIERLAEAVSKFLGHPIEQRLDAEGKLYQNRTVGFEISIFEADGFVDDHGIEFEKYPLMVSIHGLSSMNEARYFDEWFRLCALMLGDIISRKLVCECLVVKNLFDVIELFPSPASGE